MLRRQCEVLDAAARTRRAERKLGELLEETVRPGNPQLSHDDTIEKRLPDGISRMQSHRWQTRAGLPEPDFEREIATAVAQDEELTTVRISRLAREQQNAEL